MSARPIDPRVLPPSIADDRGRAILALFGEISGRFDWRRDLAVTWSDVPSAMLPYAIRSLALQEIVQPGMTEAIQRRLVENAYPLHALQGKVAGVRLGLSLLGMSVDWSQWFTQVPKGAPGTYVATIRVSEEVFAGEGRVLTFRLQRAASRMVDVMKRWSQDGALRFATSAEVPVFTGAIVRQVITIRPTAEPTTQLIGSPPVFVGMGVHQRIRVSPSAT